MHWRVHAGGETLWQNSEIDATIGHDEVFAIFVEKECCLPFMKLSLSVFMYYGSSRMAVTGGLAVFCFLFPRTPVSFCLWATCYSLVKMLISVVVDADIWCHVKQRTIRDWCNYFKTFEWVYTPSFGRKCISFHGNRNFNAPFLNAMSMVNGNYPPRVMYVRRFSLVFSVWTKHLIRFEMYGTRW